MFGTQYTPRHRSLLRAVAQGRAQLSGGSHPNLRIDGLWCDQTATNELARDGLVRPSHPGTITAPLAPAVLTSAGARVLATFAVAA